MRNFLLYVSVLNPPVDRGSLPPRPPPPSFPAPTPLDRVYMTFHRSLRVVSPEMPSTASPMEDS